ncbi:MAG: tRNA (N6-isopentenyl adenosine(37)-C2)-methylthiotransferase MiaB [Lentimicrobiaceae bacterium]|nr:tRNA (N6-isopentenyl adenosine(37)-C2)-methylthiotransferase MiaB [Lentimicrobiaceae bacterium]
MNKKNLYIETYGCQMNFSDSEIVAAVLQDEYKVVEQPQGADLILINTCSIRDNAEQRVLKRLAELNALKKGNNQLRIGMIGCMAERMKDDLFQTGKVDLVVGPDAYRDFPSILHEESDFPLHVLLSEVETYDDIEPVRYGSNGISAFISIMRGCNNFCAYCVVPYTRGRERSRPPATIIAEAEKLFAAGYREITLLGQNVNSFSYKDFNFAKLAAAVAGINPLLRVRFATSHPKDLSDELLAAMAAYPNICKSIHLPAQSGSDRILQLMNRKYTRRQYLDSIARIRKYMPDCTISTDIIAGFSTETQADHADTLSLMQAAEFDYAFTFKYSLREGTSAHKNLQDDVPETLKTQRLEEIIALQQTLSLQSNRADIGKTFEVLIEGASKRSPAHFYGRNSQNKVIVFPKEDCKAGEYASVCVKKCTSATLIGAVVPIDEKSVSSQKEPRTSVFDKILTVK